MSLQHRMAAWGALWSHYGSVWSQAWRDRNSLGRQVLTEDEAAFLPAALALQAQPLSPTARWTARVLMALVACAVAWSIFGHIDIIVSAAGKIIPSDRSKTITSVEVAVVRALHVEEGARVKAGDVLVELDTSAPDADRDRARGDAQAAALAVARSKALISAVDSLTPPRLGAVPGAGSAALADAQRHLDGQWKDFYAKLVRLNDLISQYAHDLPLATQRAQDYATLAEAHDVSKHAWMEKEQARNDLAGQLSDATDQRAALIAQTRKEAHDVQTENEKLLAGSRQEVRKASEHGRQLSLIAPVDGTVQQLNVHTVGAAVPLAQPLMVIVPDEERVEIEAQLENKDVGFVQEGQSVEVKLDAFEYTKYGTVPGHVTHVSRDAIQDEKKGLVYTVRIALDQGFIEVDGRKAPLSAGLATSAEIKTGTRRVIEYVLSPLVQHMHEALHER
jgi:hemolysin D